MTASCPGHILGPFPVYYFVTVGFKCLSTGVWLQLTTRNDAFWSAVYRNTEEKQQCSQSSGFQMAAQAFR